MEAGFMIHVGHPMAEADMFSKGDVVVHPRRPEWGRGTVDRAVRIEHEGVTAQRLVVVFEHHGRVTLNTAVAPLQPGNRPNHAKEVQEDMSSTTTRTGGWLGALGEKSSNADELRRLPESMTDPFLSLARRLEATLDSYRFSTEPRSLIDWAVVQTGLSDPLSKYTRHELEQGFAHFARDRELHLIDLVRNLKRQNKTDVLQVAQRSSIPPAARNALNKAMRA